MVRPEMGVLSPEHARVLLAAAAGDRFEALYVLAVTTGMRLGELLALQWEAIDLGSPADLVKLGCHALRRDLAVSRKQALLMR
jgi:integrase